MAPPLRRPAEHVQIDQDYIFESSENRISPQLHLELINCDSHQVMKMDIAFKQTQLPPFRYKICIFTKESFELREKIVELRIHNLIPSYQL